MMKLNEIDLWVVFFYFFAMLVCAYLIRRKKQSFVEYALTNRQLPSSIIFSSLAATYIGPGYSLVLSDKGYESGLLYFFIFSFFSFQMLFTSRVLAPKLHLLSKEGCISLGDVLGHFYGKFSHKFVGVISIILTIGFSAIMAKVGGQILASLLDIKPLYGMATITIVGLIYAATGGLRAVVATESLQFSIILFSVSLLLILAYLHINNANDVVDLMLKNTASSIHHLSVPTLLGLALSFFFGEMLIPPYANRALAAKNLHSARQGFALAGIFSLFWFLLMITIGAITAALIPHKSSETSALIALTELVAMPGLSGLIVAAIAAIVMSSQESVLNAGATSFVREFGLKQNIKNARLLSIVIGALGLTVAVQAPNVIRILLLSYAVWAPAVAIPLVWALIGGRTSERFFIVMPLGLIFSLGASLLIPNATENGLALLYGILGNICGFLIAFIINATKK